ETIVAAASGLGGPAMGEHTSGATRHGDPSLRDGVAATFSADDQAASSTIHKPELAA
ncbi:MAG: hypothetical protein RJA98_1781, partial [Pseudomonadota bacterium]